MQEPPLQEPDAEELVVVAKEGAGAPAGGFSQRSEALDCIFMGRLGDDRLAIFKIEVGVGEVDDLVTSADQVHLDVTFLVVEDGLMFKGVEIKASATFAVDAGEKVEVKGRRGALHIVVGRLQDGGGFEEVDADEEGAAGAGEVGQAAKKALGVWGREVSDGGSRIVKEEFFLAQQWW